METAPNLNVWLVNPFDQLPSKNGYQGRLTELMSTFHQSGHQVTWWTSDWDHRQKERRKWEGNAETGREIILLPSLPYNRNTSLRRFRSHARFARDWLARTRRGLREGSLDRPDIVLVNLPPPAVGAAVAELKEEFGFFMVVDVQDAWPENFSQLLPFGAKWNERIGPWLFAPLKRSARKAYAAADAITAVSQDYLDVVETYRRDAGRGARGEGGSRRTDRAKRDGDAKQPLNTKTESEKSEDRSLSNKDHPTPHAPCPASLPPSAVFPIGCPADRLDVVPPAWCERPAEPFRLVYVGSMSTSYDLETLVRAMARPELASRSIELHFAGDGDAVARLRRLADSVAPRPTPHAPCPVQSHAPSIHFHGMLGQKELRALLDVCHIGLNAVQPASRIAMPNKIGDYFAAALPVLHTGRGAGQGARGEGELARLIRERDLGGLYPAGDPAGLARVGVECMDSPERMARQSANARRFAEDCLDRRVLYPRFVEWVEGRRGEH